MAKAFVLPAWQQAILVLTTTVVGIITLVALYIGKSIFIPVALAIFVTFLLAPLVNLLQRRGLGRVPAILIVVLLSAALLGGIGYVMTRQVIGLVEGLPKYTDNIKSKIKTVRDLLDSQQSGKLGKMLQEFIDEWTKGSSKEGSTTDVTPVTPGDPTQPPPTVIVQRGDTSNPWLTSASTVMGYVSEVLGTALLSAVLVVFMLVKREDLRDRLIRLAGHGRLTATTKAVDDAAQRISRFLIMQAIINASFGAVLSLGLYLIGIDHAILWGLLAAFMRYIPYVGIWVGALPPIILSLAQYEGWWHPALVLGLFLVMEFVTGNVLEPRLFGQSIGVSEVALLVAAAFWAWMWGPIGLVLSSPLTVVLAVAGKHIPHLQFLDIILGDEPPLDPEVSYYQRLLAHDQDEAAQLVLTQAKTATEDEVFDQMLVPALTSAKRDRERDDLSETDEQYIFQATREIIDEIGLRHAAASTATTAALSIEELATRQLAESEARPNKMRILAFPARDEADRLGLVMLQQLLDPAKWEMEIVGFDMLTTDFLALAIEKKPRLICVGALAPGGLAHSRYLCKRLRARLPAVKIVVGRWGLEERVEENIEQLREAGADEVEITLAAARNRLVGWLPVLETMDDKADADKADPARVKVAV